MSFQLFRLQPDPTALAPWATRHRLLSPDGDYGYALHALLSEAFGDLAPKPFHYLGGRQGLLAYTAADLEILRLNASLAPPDVARVLGLDHLEARPFPSAWRAGQRLAFEVRVRPVVRSKDGRERDAYLHVVEGTADTGQIAGNGSIAGRTVIYSDWLTQQFAVDGAAQIAEAHLDSFRLTRVLRKAGSGDNGKRKTTNHAGPDAVFKGQLLVGDPTAFNRLLARGVGRHRAFGFGMLLLRPAGSC
ncbi:MAG: type I-E CRISPR-associated protein Cas6/Cse3/CasE [Candidatus Accumulibacter sp.]|jgi:CRISPR system Cascade subunit CasE|uniref:type I-E CRISPR-associated protein Cas6/Cse3/CasE n=1 Tax=Accumulibacter sp. TaxID=2053492 RepID=UPI00258D7A48|nr:type I-E CRISPR-associated protein Cas6/Cse3/CasE [Accumulibacter sp.]MBK8113085.1 type I-E CRISPR-associated protein Cas6/Cse3/CasE [Accumulibacter sp.]